MRLSNRVGQIEVWSDDRGTNALVIPLAICNHQDFIREWSHRHVSHREPLYLGDVSLNASGSRLRCELKGARIVVLRSDESVEILFERLLLRPRWLGLLMTLRGFVLSLFKGGSR